MLLLVDGGGFGEVVGFVAFVAFVESRQCLVSTFVIPFTSVVPSGLVFSFALV